ncbi:MAG: zinc metallopeptidase, partial [Pseudomonadota bacterium]
RYVLWRHSGHIEGMPGTGSELALHLVERFALDGVKVVRGDKGANFYRPSDKTVSLSPDVYDGKSLTAVAVAAHEIGHAIQFCREEPVSQLRTKYLGKAHVIERVGSMILMAAPVLTLFARNPTVFFALGLVGVLTLFSSVLMYVAVLPEEYDASFNKALPILEEGYVPASDMPAARRILKACAYTYVAGALADIVRLWRWIRFLR